MFIIFIHNSTKKIGRVYGAIYENKIIYQHKNSKMWINLEIVDKWINLWIKEKKLCRIKEKNFLLTSYWAFIIIASDVYPKLGVYSGPS